MNIVYLWVAIILTDNQLPFLFLAAKTQHRQSEVLEMTENKQEVSKDLEKALQRPPQS